MRKLIFFALISIVGFHMDSKKNKCTHRELANEDFRDYSDAEVDRVLEQWEEDDYLLEVDELPQEVTPPAKIDISPLNQDNSEKILQRTKDGSTLMTFVKVAGRPEQDETEHVTKLWHTSLWYNDIQAERYLVGDNKAIFLFMDGSQALTAKEYLVQQEKCESVTIEGKMYEGNYHKNAPEES